MQHDNLRIDIERAEAADVYDDLLSVEVELDDELAGMFRLTISMLLQADGTWTHLDDERFSIWKRVVVTAGLADDTHQLIAGYVTDVRPCFGPGLDQCRLHVWGMDATSLMDREDKLKDWPNSKDSDIATATFGTYGLTPQVTDTGVVHDDQVSTIIQRETDIQFLRRLALRNGFECFVDGDTGYFQPPQANGTPQPVLAVHFGDETTVSRFELSVNAMAPADVAMFQVDRTDRSILDATADSPSQPPLGADAASGILGPGMNRGIVYVSRTVTTGTVEMTDLCQGLYDQGQWLVTGEGEIAAGQYGSVLKPRGTVTIKGIGETHSGVYYVTHVTHVFNAGGYTQRFRVKRNALRPTGSEAFAADTGLLAGLG